MTVSSKCITILHVRVFAEVATEYFLYVKPDRREQDAKQDMEREARQELDKRGRHIPLMYVVIPMCVITFGVCSNEISFSFE